MSDEITYDMIEKMEEQLKLAQSKNDIKVAACLLASKKNYSHSKYFYGSNIELASGIAYHAEEVALIKAINEGYIIPQRIYLYASKDKQRVPMCYSCRDKFSRVDDKCQIVVLGEDFMPLLVTSVELSINFPYKPDILIS